MSIPTLTITPGAAASAYQSVAGGTAVGTAQSGAGSGFGAMLQRALDGAVSTGHAADAQALDAIGGSGNLTDVVTAVSKAELTLQTAVTIRDRMVQAYQDIMHMAI